MARLALTVVFCLAAAIAGAEPVTTIRNNGSSANRVDLVILGDGYTAANLASGKYASDVEAALIGFFAEQPFNDYRNYFNVHRIDVTSNQDGADHPARGIFRDTALDASYDCSGITRLICISGSKVTGALTRSISDPAARDVVLIIVNDTEYGGSGGTYSVASVHSQAVELVLHELGHGFGLLADEYGGPPPPACVTSEPSNANATRVTVRSQIKWNAWIDAATPVPTGGSANGIPGLYEGAVYCDTGAYRPTFNSKMRGLGRPFEQINTEQILKRIYNYVSPIDSVTPAVSGISISRGSSQGFTVTTPSPLSHALNVAWVLDGQTVGAGPAFALSGSIRRGLHTLEARVSDPTALVRVDPAHVLSETYSWSVNVIGGASINDFDGDGKADVTVFRASSGTWYTGRSSDATSTSVQWGLPGDIPVAGDYDGDGKADSAVFRPSTAQWYIRNSATAALTLLQWGVTGDIPVPGDYDGDGKTDVAVYRQPTGTWYVRTSSLATLVTVALGVRADIPVPADYDGDGRTDIATYRPSTGMWNIRRSSTGYATAFSRQWGLNTDGDIPVPGDYDGDGAFDLAVYRPWNGTWHVLQSSTNFTTSVSYQWGLSGDIAVPDDYDGDGKTDAAVYRPANGTWYVLQSSTNFTTWLQYQWGLNGDTPVPNALIANAIAAIAAKAPVSTLANLVRGSDMDGDGKSDITVWRPSTGEWFTRRSSANFTAFDSVAWGLGGDLPVPGDYDGDGITDVAAYRPTDHIWRVRRSGNLTAFAVLWGENGDSPVPGDYDGDGRTDFAVYRPSTGVWWILRSSSNFTTVLTLQWGLVGDVTAPGDYDGDGLADLAVYRPSTGEWFIRESDAGFMTRLLQWGLIGDISVPGDYDGDGRTDLAVFRPSTGTWFILKSSTGYMEAESAMFQWGLNGDTPVPGDFDGDGRTDLAVFRPSANTWFILRSGTNFTMSWTFGWGLNGDIPILRRP